MLGSADDHRGSGGRNRAQIGEQLHAVLAGAENRQVRHKFLRGSGVETERIDANRGDVALLNEESRSDTYPYMEIEEERVSIGHEASVSKLGEEQLFYLMSRGLTEQQAALTIVNGFIEPFTKELPLEYAVELNRLIQLEMQGSVG